MSDKLECTHCDGDGTLFRDPYGNAMPCSRCSGSGVVPSVPYVMMLAYSLGMFRSLKPDGEVDCPDCAGGGTQK